MRTSFSILAVVAVCGVMLGFASNVHAQSSTDALRSAGITPNSPLFVIDRFFERATLFLSRGEAARARRLAAFAEERAAELASLAERGEDTEEARALYEEQLNESLNRANESEDAEAIAAVSDATGKHLSVLERVREQVPEQARAGIDRALERARTGHFTTLESLETRAPERFVNVGMNSARRRLAAARENVEEGDVEQASRILDEFERVFGQIRRARQQGDAEQVVAVAEEYGEHMEALLDGFDAFDELPQGVQDRISSRLRLLKGVAIDDHGEALQRIAEQNPERAAELFSEAAERRAEAAERASERRSLAEERRSDVVNERVNEYERYAQFGEEISETARRIRSGDATADDVVERATSRHREVLQRVRGQVPEEARQGIDRALENIDRRTDERQQRERDADEASSQCEADWEQAGEASEGRACTQIVSPMTCPHDRSVTRTATDGCMISELRNLGWSEGAGRVQPSHDGSDDARSSDDSDSSLFNRVREGVRDVLPDRGDDDEDGAERSGVNGAANPADQNGANAARR